MIGRRDAGDLTETQYDVQSVTAISVVRNSQNEPVANLTSQPSAAVPLTDLKSLKVSEYDSFFFLFLCFNPIYFSLQEDVLNQMQCEIPKRKLLKKPKHVFSLQN